MASLKHPHTYERMNKPKQEYYRCIHPDCSHYIHKSLMKRKRATCICGNEYFITNDSLKLKRPHCENCGRYPKEAVTIAPELMQPAEIDSSLQVDIPGMANKFEGDFGGEI